MIPSKILYVEDDPTDLLLLKRTLENAELRIKLFHVLDGRAAIQWLQGWGLFVDRTRFPMPDLLITDLDLRGTHGFDVIKWVRAQKPLQKIPILVLSGADDVSLIREASELGATAF